MNLFSLFHRYSPLFSSLSRALFLFLSFSLSPFLGAFTISETAFHLFLYAIYVSFSFTSNFYWILDIFFSKEDFPRQPEFHRKLFRQYGPWKVEALDLNLKRDELKIISLSRTMMLDHASWSHYLSIVQRQNSCHILMFNSFCWPSLLLTSNTMENIFL